MTGDHLHTSAFDELGVEAVIGSTKAVDEEAVRAATGAAVSSYGMADDALAVDSWDLNESGGVLR